MTIPDEAYHAALNAFAEADSHEDALMKALTAALPFLPVQGAQLSPKDRNIAEIGGLVDTLRSMSHDDNTRACVSVNITASNDLAKKLFDVLHAAPKAATAIEAQAAELADATRRAERALAFIATLEAQLAEARKALELFEHYGCPICHGDCASANPPVYYCPMEAVRRVREGGAHG